MAVFFDPKTGERYDNVPDGEVERARGEFGLLSAEEYEASKESFGKKAARVGAATVGAPLELASRVLPEGWRPPRGEEELAKQSPAARAFYEQSQKTTEDFFRKAQLAGEVDPVAGFVGAAVPGVLTGALAGGLGVGAASGLGYGPLVGAGAGLIAESATSGISQEAIDAITSKRDFSAKSALMKGGLDLFFGAAGAGAARVLGGLGGDAARAEARALSGVDPEQAVPGSRNILAELDPGEVPEAVSGAARAGKRARSAGAAGASNAPYRKPTEAGRGAEGAANDVEAFADDLYDAAARDLRDGPDGKPLVKEAQFLSDNSDSLTELAAQNTADHLDDVRRIVKEDLSVSAKVDDLSGFERQWTPEQRTAQKAWAKEAVEAEADDILRKVEASQKAAADVRAGRAGAREAGVEAIDAGGIDARIGTTLRMGLDKVRRAEGAAQAEAVDQLKRGVGLLVRDIGRSGSLDEGTKAARTELLRGFYTTLQEGLQDEAKYGGFAALQRDTNAAFTDLIEAQGRLDTRMTERLGDTWGAAGQQKINRRTVAGKVAGVMRSGPLEQREIMRDAADVIDATRRLAEARRAHGLGRLERLDRLDRGLTEFVDDLKFARTLQVAQRVAKDATPGIGERLADAGIDLVAGRVPVVGGALKKEGRGLLERFSKSAELPAKGTALREAIDNRLKAYSRNPELGDIGYSGTLPKWLQESLRGHGGQVAGVAAVLGGGSLLSGEAGAAELGGQLGAQYLPEQKRARDEVDARLAALPPEEAQLQLRTAEAFARIGHDVNRRVEAAVSDLFSIARDPRAPPKHRSPAARALDKRAAELDVPRHVARFMGKHDDPVLAWRDKSKSVTAIVRDPARLARSMAESLGDLPRQEPEIFAGMVAHTVATAQYLYETMPVTSGRSALDPVGYPPTHEEIDEWAGHWVGAVHPLDTLDDLASNDLVPEQMQAVQALSPEAYQMFQVAAMKQIDALSKRRKAIPIEALEQIDTALDLDGAGEPTLSSAMAALYRKAEKAEEQRLAQEAQAQPPPPGPTQPQGPSRLASSALGSLHGAGA